MCTQYQWMCSPRSPEFCATQWLENDSTVAQISILSDIGANSTVLGLPRWPADEGCTVCIYRSASIQAGDMVRTVAEMERVVATVYQTYTHHGALGQPC